MKEVLTEGVTLYCGDCRDVLKTLPDESVHCVVTSPPYWGLRDYGTAKWEGGDAACGHRPPKEGGASQKQTSGQQEHAGRFTGPTCWRCGARRIDNQIGLEPSFTDYIETMRAVFAEVRRVLRKDGTLWLNMGDSYAATSSNLNKGFRERDNYGHGGGQTDMDSGRVNGTKGIPFGLKPKDLCGIPWRLAFALQADGWYLRSDIIWSKPNPMPESVTDRPTKAHEYLFLMTKSERYYYDAEAIKEPNSPTCHSWTAKSETDENEKTNLVGNGHSGKRAGALGDGRNRRSVWEIPTSPFPEAHFATFPPALVEPCILAGCPQKCCAKCGAPWVREVEIGEPDKETTRGTQAWAAVTGQQDSAGGLPHRERKTIGFSPSCSCNAGTVPGTCLDPFGGAGTTGLVAIKHNRATILIELNKKYLAMSKKRIMRELNKPSILRLPSSNTNIIRRKSGFLNAK